MTVIALGLNHTTAPLDLRGRFALPDDQLPQALQALREALARALQATTQQVQTAILSTCNRTDLFCHVDGSADAPQQLCAALDWLATRGGVAQSSLQKHVYTLQAGDAARHAFRVASGLDSMVLGESQILGQFKTAVKSADAAGTLGSTLNQLFQRSFSVAKDVRSQTELAQASISMPAAAVKLAQALFEDLSATRMLFVGAGEMIELAATHFAAHSPKQIVIANRSAERSSGLALRLNQAQEAAIGKAQAAGTQAFARSISLAELPTRLHEFDVVVSCTASTLPIIGLGAVERALKARKHKPMFMVDLAVPRDIEIEVKRLSDVYLYTVDDLSTLVQQGKASRQAAVAQAQTIVDAGVESFMAWMQARQSLPLIQRLNAQADAWREAELARAKKSLAKGDDPQAVLEAMSKALMQKALHASYAALNSADPLERERAAAGVEQLLLRH